MILRKPLFATKLSVSVIFTILLPLLISIVLLYNVWQNVLQEKANEYLHNIADISIAQLENSIEYVEQTAFYVVSNDSVQHILLSEKNNSEVKDEYIEYQELRKLLSSYIAVNDEITAMYLRGQDQQIYSYTKTGSPFAIVDELLKEAFEKSGEWLVIDGNTFYVQEVRKYLEEPLGKLVINVNPDALYKVIQNMEYFDSAEVYLINKKNQVVVCKEDGEYVSEYLPEPYQSLQLQKNEIHENIWIGGERKTVYSSQVTSNGWRLILSIPTQYYMKDIVYFQNKMLVFISVMAVVGLLGVVVISKQLTKPLEKLAHEMKKVGRGDLRTYLTVGNGDEIATLNETFNQMVKDMRYLIKNEYQQKVMIQGAEMKSLQMQINPHFLYNTLDTINWMARARGNEEVGDITSALGKLMRYSLAKKEYVTLREEIQHIRHYVYIQDVRYGDKVTVYFEIQEEVEAYYIPKLLIQPILENAIVHGVEDKVDESKIYVKAFEEGEDIRIIIQDDGVGMTQEVQDKLLSEKISEKEGHTSIGIYNVNRRIQMTYGKEYGLQIQSTLGGGTTASFRIKKKMELDEKREEFEFKLDDPEKEGD